MKLDVAIFLCFTAFVSGQHTRGSNNALETELEIDIPVCVPGLPGIKKDGDSCLLGCECGSGRCDFKSITGGMVCYKTLAVGEGCNENSDCASGKCEGTKYHPLFPPYECVYLEIGETCTTSDYCKSGRCEFA